MFQIFGRVSPPPSPLIQRGPTGIVDLLNIAFGLFIVIAGLYTLLNLIFAGFQFISAGGDSKQVEAAWGKIWQSLVGLFIVAGSLVLAAIIGWVLFGDTSAILRLKIFTP